MDHSSAAAYVYAKASGMLAKSFTGKRISELFEVKSLSELWTVVFGTEVPLVPENLLVKKIEIEAENRFIADFVTLLDTYSKPDPILVSLLQFFEYNNLKELAAALSLGETVMPQILNIGKYSLLSYDYWPDLAKITQNTSLAWYNSAPELTEQKNFDRRLDLQYTREVWKAAGELPAAERRPVLDFLEREIVYRNIVWGIRLRVYYDMKKEEIIPWLASLATDPDIHDTFAGPVLRVLDLPIDSWKDWESWTYASFLNPHEEGVVWKIDPRWLQKKTQSDIYNHALRQFHRYPFTAHVLVTWFRIKQHELDCIRTAAEALRLNLPAVQVKDFAGVS
jgi:vacuolar-type H+-ATPase subunit C/Vma6